MKYSDYLSENDFKQELTENQGIKWYCKAYDYQKRKKGDE